MAAKLPSYIEFIAEYQLGEEKEHKLEKHEWPKDHKVGWWRDAGDHYVMHHGTHEKNLDSIAKNGLHAPKEGSTKGWVSMTHDPHTAHAYASMSGGENTFRAAGGKATHTPHEHRAVVVAHIPKDWAISKMDKHLGGNIGDAKKNLEDESRYKKHKAEGKSDSEYYSTSELRFKDHIPPEFIKGYYKKHG